MIGCATTNNAEYNAKPAQYEKVESQGRVSGVGIESQDVVDMTNLMMKDIQKNPAFSNPGDPPRVIIDAEYFINESSMRIDKNLITDRLRVNLNRTAAGKMLFIGRQYGGMIEGERALKRKGQADQGTLGKAEKQLGADYRLAGRITTQDAIDPKTGARSRYNMITFEMVDLETGEIVWSNIYEFKKSAQDDIVYR